MASAGYDPDCPLITSLAEIQKAREVLQDSPHCRVTPMLHNMERMFGLNCSQLHLKLENMQVTGERSQLGHRWEVTGQQPVNNSLYTTTACTQQQPVHNNSLYTTTACTQQFVFSNCISTRYTENEIMILLFIYLIQHSNAVFLCIVWIILYPFRIFQGERSAEPTRQHTRRLWLRWPKASVIFCRELWEIICIPYQRIRSQGSHSDAWYCTGRQSSSNTGHWIVMQITAMYVIPVTAV